jgi:hypothetical protein
MRPSAFSIIALTLVGSALSAQAPAALPGSVAGHVYCADTHTPCRFASVTLEAVPQSKAGNSASPNSEPRNYAAETDLDGAFQIDGVPPGDYYILARLTGYFLPYDLAVSEFPNDPVLRAKAIDAALPRISVSAGLVTTSALNLSLGASLSGTVRYDDGGLASTLRLSLFRKDESGKWKSYVDRSADPNIAPLGMGTHTDSRGRFSVLGLPAGIFCIEIMLPEASSVSNTITGNPSITYRIAEGNALRIYNGDKYRLRDATSIELHEGEDRSGIDINIPTQNLHSIHGSVVARSDGRSITAGTVRLLDPDDKTLLRKTAIGSDGTFSFNYLFQGTYLVQIEGAADNRKDKPGTGYESITAPLLIEKDITDLSYSLAAAKH